MRFTSVHAPNLTFFPKDGNTWRVDWYGDVSFPDRRQSYKQPSVCVAISKVLLGHAERSEQPHSARNQRQIWVPVGLLPHIRIGDIWQNGLRLALEQAPSISFDNLRISRSSCRVVKAGFSKNDRMFLLPAEAHPWHMHHTHSYCVVVKTTHDRQLVIPCTELIRFYFGSSSSLIARLFSPPLTRKQLYTASRYCSTSGRLYLKLAQGVSGYSASDIGRIHQDRAAWAAASEIGASLIAATMRKEKAYPRSHFPFSGETSLVVTGQWLPFGGEPDKSFLVHSIQSCSHPFPFRTLAYDMIKSHAEASIEKNRGLSATHGQTSKFSRLTNSPSVVHRDPSKFFSPSIWHTYQGVKFPDLETKSVFKKGPSTFRRPEQSTQLLRASKADAFAISEPSGTQRPVRPLTLEISPRTSSPPPFLQPILTELFSIPALSLNLMTESHHDGWCVSINAMQDDNRVIDNRLYIKENKTERVRRACVLHIEIEDQSLGLLVVLENTPARVYFDRSVQANDDGVAHALQATALSFLKGHATSAQSKLRQLRKIAKELGG